jgi:AcrR family transcriptional regulator
MHTKDRILDAAEHLFADHGFGATSMRAITSDAGVNLAAVNYHFGTKEALIEAVFARRLGPLNRERLAALDGVEAMPAADRTVELVIEAFVGPAFRMRMRPEFGGETFMRLLGQTMGQPRGPVRDIFTHQFEEVIRRFTAALGRVQPELAAEEIQWRFLFTIGSMAFVMSMGDEVFAMCGKCGSPHDMESVVERLVPFVAAGLRAPVPDGVEP